MSYFDSDMHVGRMTMRRVEVVEVDDAGPQQFVTVKGLEGEVFKMPYRGQYHGATSNPVKGSHGFAILVAGRPELAQLVGLEHPDYRPRNLPEGATKLYDKDGTFVYLDAAGNVHAKTRLKAFVEAGTEAEVKAPTIKLTGNVVIDGNLNVSGNVTNDGNMTTGGVHTDQIGGHI